MANDLTAKASSPPLPQHEALRSHNRSAVAVATSPDMSRRGPPSTASDTASVVSALAAAGSPPYLATVNPKPSYISHENAARLILELYRVQREFDSDDDGDGDDAAAVKEPGGVQVVEGAVQHVNAFLDKLLHDILAYAGTTRLSQLRSAVAKVLRKSLGQEAVNFADANLEDLLAVGAEADDADEQRQPTAKAPGSSAWNLEDTWTRSRLRVMMRSEKSDFDIDDHDRWVQREALISHARPLSQNATVISLQSEIFLAGALDFVSDQLFNLCIIPATVRARRGSKKSKAQQESPDHLVIEECDLEKGVLNSPLDKLWRIWRKSQRSRGIVGSPRHGYSYSNLSSPVTTRRPSDAWAEGPYHGASPDLATPRGMPGEFVETPTFEVAPRDTVPDMDEHPEHVIASNIPIPVGRRDVDEIEVPGLAKDPDEEEEPPLDEPRRASYDPPRRPSVEPVERPRMPRKRSSSTPAPYVRDFARNSDATMSEIPNEPSAAEIAAAAGPDPHQTFSLKTEPLRGKDGRGDTGTVASTGRALVREDSNGETDQSSIIASAAAATTGAAVVAAGTAALASRHARSPEAKDALSLANDGAMAEDGSPKQNRRNREAAVGLGHPNGISIPVEAATGQVYMHQSMSDEKQSVTKENPDLPSSRSPSEMSKLRPGSVSSDTEASEVMSPRDFMSSRNLQYTRGIREEALPEDEPYVPLSSNKPPPPVRNKLQTSGFGFERGDPSPVSPMSAVEGLAGIPESGGQPSSFRKASAPAGRLVDDLARVRGSPKTRQASLQENGTETSLVHRKDSLRRIAVERNGSLVSLVDDSTNKVRSKPPLTSSSITTAEDFDSLLNGGETIKMTLSPSSVREAPSNPTSRSGSLVDTTSVFGRLSGGNSPKIGSSPKLGNVLHKKLDDSPNSKSPSMGSEKSKRGRTNSTATTKSESRRSISRPSVRNKSRTRTGLTAREPTVQTDSTLDFADFIRSTGPDREPQTLVPALTNRTSAILDAQRQSSVGGHGSTRGPLTQSESAPALSQPQVTENAGIKYKRSLAPREARGSDSAGNDGLIDFIRTGPNPGKESRPSKDIAPFRYSMDSDDMRAAYDASLDHPSANGRTPSIANGSFSNNRSSIGTVATMQTMTTYSSHAPLVGNRGISAEASNASLHQEPAPTTPKLGHKPAKKSTTTVDSDGITRYRNKDPYAIDYSDDDDDDDDEDEEEEEDPRSRVPQLPRKPLSSPPQQQSSPAKTKASPLAAASRSPPLSSNPRIPPLSAPSPGTKSSPTPPASGLALNGISFQPNSETSTSATSPTVNTANFPASAAVPSSKPSPSSALPAAKTAGIPTSGAGPNAIAAVRPVASTKTASGGVIPRNPYRMQAADAGAATRRKESSSTRELADFFRDSGPPGDDRPTNAAAGSKAARMMGGGGGGAAVAASAPSPNIGGRTGEHKVTAVKAEEAKKGKFWSRKR